MHIPAALLPHRVKFRPEYYSRYEGEIDEFGYSSDTIKHWQPFLQFLYEGYFQVETVGLENIPDQGRALLIGNHSGVLPMDAFMTNTAIILHHPSPRRVRCLTHDFLQSGNHLKRLITAFGGVPAKYDIAKTLLETDELVFFYPEGARGPGKPFSMRYRLHDFDPGFVKAAIATGAPIVPIVTIGGDEIYPLIGNLKTVARVMAAPYWPVTPTYPLMPWIAGCIPLPIKFMIRVGKPIYLDYPPERAGDKRLRLRIAREIQYDIQREINALLRERKSPFSGW